MARIKTILSATVAAFTLTASPALPDSVKHCPPGLAKKSHSGHNDHAHWRRGDRVQGV
jgi:hypothetical protein